MPATEAQVRTATARLRQEADALLVLVITPEHVMYSEDAKLTPVDIQRILQDEAATIANDVRARRQKAKAAR